MGSNGPSDTALKGIAEQGMDVTANSAAKQASLWIAGMLA